MSSSSRAGLARPRELRKWTIVHVFDEFGQRFVEFAQFEDGAVSYLAKSVATKAITSARLAAAEADVRPAVWPAPGIPPSIPSSLVFVGSRQAWGDLNNWEFGQILRAVRGLSGVPAGVPVSLAHAFLLWLMEGKAQGTTTNGLVPGIRVISEARRPFTLRANPPFDLKTGADYHAASPAQIRSLVRMWAFYELFGLDDFNHHSGTGDNPPTFDAATPIATLVANHNAAFDAARARIVVAGMNPPDRATIDAAFSATRTGAGPTTDWEIRCASDCVERIIALQYSEFLRRVALLPPNVTGTVPDLAGNPFDARRFPAFCYMAFNGGITVSRVDQTIDPTKRVFVEWSHANAEIGTVGCPALDPEAALRCQKVTAQEVAFMISLGTRRGSARLNGIHFGVLADSYGRVFPLRF